MKTTIYHRNPLVVEAVRVTNANMNDVADWCGGRVRTLTNGRPYIDVPVLHPKSEEQKNAQVGDWVLKSENGFKVYLNRAFRKGFYEPEFYGEKDETVVHPNQLEFAAPPPAKIEGETVRRSAP